MAVQDKKEDRKGISPAVIIIPLGLGLGAVAVLGIAAMAMAATPTPPPGRANLYGKVTDADSGAPAAGALITLDSMTTYSDADGNYALTDIAPGSYNITVEHIGHISLAQSVTLSEGMNQINVQLVPGMEIKEVWIIWEPTLIPNAVSGDAMSVRGTLLKNGNVVASFEKSMTLLVGPGVDPNLGKKLLFEGVVVADTLEVQPGRQSVDHYLMVDGKKYLLVADIAYIETWGLIHTFNLLED